MWYPHVKALRSAAVVRILCQRRCCCCLCCPGATTLRVHRLLRARRDGGDLPKRAAKPDVVSFGPTGATGEALSKCGRVGVCSGAKSQGVQLPFPLWEAAGPPSSSYLFGTWPGVTSGFSVLKGFSCGARFAWLLASRGPSPFEWETLL